ncbi:MAG: hypothetical protein Tsb0017_05450 [Geothermobacteraceae bacterium]
MNTATRVLVLLVVLWGLVPTMSGQGGSRSELGRILETIPPDGPPWSYGNVILRPARGGRMDPAVFPHWLHRSRYTCRVCHLELGFSIRRGETGISRSGNLAGRHCGACHNGKIAFSVRSQPERQCQRCHTRDLKPLKRRFEQFAAGMPESRFGNGIDWAAALREGLLDLQDSLGTKQQTRMRLPPNLARDLELGTRAPRSGVRFSHREHFAEMDCSNCHPDIFQIQRSGTELFSMERNIFGWYCGSCHMRVAFPMSHCNGCHPGMRDRLPGRR